MDNNTEENTRILLVEDDELNVRMVLAFLNSKYKIEAVSSGEEALKKLLDNTYDIILMDIGLKKGMNGLDVTKTLRKMPNYKNIPVIALTAYALSGDREKILSAGCSHYLSKPFTRKQLIDLLESVIKK